MRRLDKAIEKAWDAYDNAAELSSRGSPAAPILFFGDLGAYRKSSLRVLTVGKNPSWQEFPDGERWRRFPLMKGNRKREPAPYLNALSAYFCTDPYKPWFDPGFEKVLNEAGSSYYQGRATSTALHTDICSPVATDPPWSDLEKDHKDEYEALKADGVPLWHDLLKILKPQIVLLSFAKEYLELIEFTPITKWKVIYTSTHTKDDTPRKKGPYKVCACRYKVGGKPTLFVFGPGNNTPFQDLDDNKKCKVGKRVRDHFEKTIGI